MHSVHVDDDMILPAWSAYGGGESGRETNMPPKRGEEQLREEENGTGPGALSKWPM